MLSRFIGVPPGTQVRKYYPSATGDERADAMENMLGSHDFINTIVDITADDVCLGCNPFYLQGTEHILSPELIKRYKRIVNALNKISRWVAVDLLKRGYSVYELRDQKIVVGKDENEKPTYATLPTYVPVFGAVTFYMSADGKVDTFIDGKKDEKVLTFLNYSRETIAPIKDGTPSGASTETPDGYAYQVMPEPVQLKHVQTVATDLYSVERAIYRYRIQLSRIVRFAEVEAGIQLGNDNNNLAIDNAAAAVNANSQSMDAVMLDPLMAFDDNLPVVPIHDKVGHIEVKSDIPDFNQIKELPDLEYTINRMFLAMRFPKSYADFNTALSDTAVSLIRGDVRYARMVDYCRSLMETTVNTRLFGPMFDPSTAETLIKLTSLPSSEDDDVVDALDKFQQFTSSAFDFIGAAETKDEAEVRLKSITILLGDTANLASIQRWSTLMMDYIAKKFKVEESDENGANSDDSDTAPDDTTEETGSDETGSVDIGGGESDDASAVNPHNESAAAFELPPLQ